MAGGPVRQPCAKVVYLPPVRDYEFSLRRLYCIRRTFNDSHKTVCGCEKSWDQITVQVFTHKKAVYSYRTIDNEEIFNNIKYKEIFN